MNSNDILIANTDDLRSDMDYLEKTLLKGHRIDPNLYEEYDVKRGLRDSTGRGVLTGLTEVSDVCGFDVVNGRKIPAEGGLYYQGINVNDLINGLKGKRFGFEETTFLLLFGRLPKKDELDDFAKTIADSMEKVREETQRTEEEFKNLTDSIRNQYGGQIADFATRFAELAKFIQDGGSTTEAAAAGLVMLGDSLQTIAGNGAIAKAGAIMAAIGQCVLGFATASAQAAALGPFAWLAFVGAGLGTLATMISTIQGFSNGGIIGGATTSGDMQLARVNAGEMILNNSQQARLFDLLDGGAAMIGNTQGKVDFRISGQALVGTLRNYNTKMSKVK